MKTYKTYIRGSLLGRGGNAVCFESTSVSSHIKYAMKVIPKALMMNRPSYKSALRNEINIHRQLEHRSIVKFFRFFEDKKNVYLLTELCKTENLFDKVTKMKHLDEAEVKRIMIQIIDAVHYLHHKNILHRDLKPANIFLKENGSVCLGDFGLAIQLKNCDEKRLSNLGTPNYMCPEVLTATEYSFGIDIWALGVIMYFLLFGKAPFESNNVKNTYANIRLNAYSFPSDISISNEAKSLIQQLLSNDSTQRPTITDLKTHSYFQSAISLSAVRVTQVVNCSNSSANSSEGTGIWASTRISKHIDYSSKYGLGYQTSDGRVGVYFNDSSKMFEDYHRICQYIESPYAAEKKSSDLSKKNILFQHFRNCLQSSKPSLEVSSCELIYLKQWYATRSAYFFRLSNGIVQAVFIDGTEIYFDSKLDYFTFLDSGQKETQFVITALESWPGVVIRKWTDTVDFLQTQTHTQTKNLPAKPTAFSNCTITLPKPLDVDRETEPSTIVVAIEE